MSRSIKQKVVPTRGRSYSRISRHKSRLPSSIQNRPLHLRQYTSECLGASGTSDMFVTDDEWTI